MTKNPGAGRESAPLLAGSTNGIEVVGPEAGEWPQAVEKPDPASGVPDVGS